MMIMPPLMFAAVWLALLSFIKSQYNDAEIPLNRDEMIKTALPGEKEKYDSINKINAAKIDTGIYTASRE
jgi:hypothetical protein